MFQTVRFLPIAVLLCVMAIQGWIGDAKADPLQRALDDLVQESAVPGAVALLDVAGRRQTRASGLASPAGKAGAGGPIGGTRMQTDSVFRIDNASRMFLAVLALRLEMRGDLDLKASMRSVLPERLLKQSGLEGDATIQQLLTGQTPFADFMEAPSFYKALTHPRRPRFNSLALLEFAARPDREEEWDQGKADFSPKATDTLLLAELLAAAGGEPIEKLLQKHVWSLAKMKQTRFGDRDRGVTVTGDWDFDGDGVADNSFDPVGRVPGAASTAGDMANFLHTLFRTRHLLDDSQLDRMIGGGSLDYGLGLELADTPLGPAFGHTASSFGHVVEAWYVPEVDTILVWMANAEDRPMMALDFLQRWLPLMEQ